MRMQASGHARSTRVKRMVLGALAGLAIVGGGLGAAQPAAAATYGTITSTNDIWTTSYYALEGGTSLLDAQCNADARARGYKYGRTYVKSATYVFNLLWLKVFRYEVVCRAYWEGTIRIW